MRRKESGSPSARVTCSSWPTSALNRSDSFWMRLSAASILAGSRQFDGHSQARQRRPQLVRDIEQQAALGSQQGLDALRHLIEGARELSDSSRAELRARREIAVAEAFHGLCKLRNGGSGRAPASSTGRSPRHHEEVFGLRNRSQTGCAAR